MSWTSAAILYTILWPLAFFCMLPLRIRSQSEGDEVIPGTPGSAPIDPGLRWKVRYATVLATALWAVVAGVIHFELITLADLGVNRDTGGYGSQVR